MIDVKAIGHATFETPDIARMVDYYTHVLGLHPEYRDANRAVFVTEIGRETLVLEKGEAARCTRIALQAAPGTDLGAVARDLSERENIRAERRSGITPGITDALVFKDPIGTDVELFTAWKGGERRQTGGISPLKLGHIAFTCPDVKLQCAFYERVLGFRVSDWMEDFFVFMRCGPDHHTCNFIDGPDGAMHHMAFELKDWAHVLSACDLLAHHRRPIIWGPGRHEVGHNIFIYHRDPDDHIIELFTEIDLMKDESLGYFEPRPWHRDRPQRPKVWGREEAAPQWGLPPSADFRRQGEQHLARQGHNG